MKAAVLFTSAIVCGIVSSAVRVVGLPLMWLSDVTNTAGVACLERIHTAPRGRP
jgi:hypothetical protein